MHRINGAHFEPLRGSGVMIKETEHIAMNLLAISVGLPRDVAWNGRTVTTAIFKEPVAGPVRLGKTNLDGDRRSKQDGVRVSLGALRFLARGAPGSRASVGGVW